MKKILTLFERDWHGNHQVVDKLSPGCEWVIAGEGVPTVKYDGTACLVRGGKLYKRYELKPNRAAPVGFEAAQEADPITSEMPGWVPVGDGPEDKWHREPWMRLLDAFIQVPDGTYELIGPKVQGNPQHSAAHHLVRHGQDILSNVPATFDGLAAYLAEHPIEGIVWHHPDGRMVKIKRRDFGLQWPATK